MITKMARKVYYTRFAPLRNPPETFGMYQTHVNSEEFICVTPRRPPGNPQETPGDPQETTGDPRGDPHGVSI